MYADNLLPFFSFLSLHLCLCLRNPGLHVRRNDTSTSTRTREWKSFHCLVLVLMLASLRRTCKRRRRRHNHKRNHKALMLALHQFTRKFLVLMLVLMVMLASFVWTRLKGSSFVIKPGLLIKLCISLIDSYPFFFCTQFWVWRLAR